MDKNPKDDGRDTGEWEVWFLDTESVEMVQGRL